MRYFLRRRGYTVRFIFEPVLKSIAQTLAPPKSGTSVYGPTQPAFPWATGKWNSIGEG